MFKKMRRSEKQTSVADAEAILRSQNFGILSVIGNDGYPYGVPVNYVYEDGKILFHSTSAESHKIESIIKNEKVCFSVVTEHDLVPEKLDTMYTSVIAFGRARVLTKKEEILEALRTFLAGLSPNMVLKTRQIYEAEEGKFLMIEITVEHFTGKIGR